MRLVLTITLYLLTSLSQSAPVVIYDSGQTQSLLGYLVHIKRPKNPGTAARMKPMPTVYPVMTPELTPDTVQPRSIHYPHLKQPLFVIGYDALSLRWLKLFHTTLLQHKAVGLVVNVSSKEEMAAIKDAAPGLEIYPGPGSQLAMELDLHHYPALISANRIEQ